MTYKSRVGAWLKRIAIGTLATVSVIGLLVFVVLLYQGKRQPYPPTQEAKYVALGSSFAAGLGLGQRASGSPYACQRSINGYPPQLARLIGLPLIDMTCSGATTSNVLRGGQYFQGPQIDQLDLNTKLVTLTTGGNDISYIGDLILMSTRAQQSVVGSILRLFGQAELPAEQREFTKLYADLLATLVEVKRRAPNARVIVVTYPIILPSTGTCKNLGISDTQAALMRRVSNRLAEVTRATAQKAGVTVVDMAALSIGHDACSPISWVNGSAPNLGAPFHPTLAGAEATAQQIQQALGWTTKNRSN